MRHINDALDTFFVYWVPDLIEHQAQENRKGKRDEQDHQADDQRVSKDAHEAGAGQKAFEILEPDERAVQQTQARLVIHKGDAQAPDRTNFEKTDKTGFWQTSANRSASFFHAFAQEMELFPNNVFLTVSLICSTPFGPVYSNCHQIAYCNFTF